MNFISLFKIEDRLTKSEGRGVRVGAKGRGLRTEGPKKSKTRYALRF